MALIEMILGGMGVLFFFLIIFLLIGALFLQIKDGILKRTNKSESHPLPRTYMHGKRREQ